MRALGDGGQSEPSAAFGPVTLSTDRIFVEELASLDQMVQSTNLAIDETNADFFDGDTARLTRADVGNGEAVWTFQGMVRKIELLVYHWPLEDRGALVLETSEDGQFWHEAEFVESEKGGDWELVVVTATVTRSEDSWFRLTFVDHDGEIWNPQVGQLLLTWDPGS
jgi:hypothetical protein